MLQERIRRVGLSPQAATILLIFNTMAWGLSYVVIKIGAQTIPPFELIALRFTIASLICVAIFRKSLVHINARAILYGTILGITMFIGSTTMVYGVQTTDASTATFIASTKIVFVPLLLALWTHRLPDKRIILGTIGTTVGIALLSLENGLTFSTGAVLCIASAIAYALHILFTGAMARKEDAILIGVLQQVVMALLGIVCMLVFNTPLIPKGVVPWTTVLVLALVNGVFVFVSQPVAQRFASAEFTALIFAMEPVFGAIFSVLLMDDRFTLQNTLGALLVLMSVLLSSIQKKPRQS